MDSRKRLAINAWAMKKARQHYKSLGYELKDTSKVAPFDYEAWFRHFEAAAGKASLTSKYSRLVRLILALCLSVWLHVSPYPLYGGPV